MAEQLGDWTRTHTCGALRATDLDTEATVLGWVHRVRDLGGEFMLDKLKATKTNAEFFDSMKR